MRRAFVALIATVALLTGGLSFSASAHAVTASVTTGTLVTVSGTTAPATLSVLSGTTTFTVNVSTTTVLVRKFNGTSSLDEFAAGDMLQITGVVTGSTIDATRIKDLTIQRIGGVLQGKIVSINATAKTFVMKPEGRVNQTVTVPTTAKVFKGQLAGTFSDLAVGQTVKVVGLWRKTLMTMTADRVMIKASELNGKVASIDCTAGTMTVTKSGKKNTTTTWTIALTDTTAYRDRGFHQIACADIMAGDSIHVRGFSTGSKAMSALQVWDSTVKKTASRWSGKVSNVDSTAMMFTLDQKKGVDFQVTTSAETIIVNSKGTIVPFSSVVNTNSVTVWGVRNGSTITANLIVDSSLQ